MTDHKKLLTANYFLAYIALGMISGAYGPAVPSFAANTASELNEVSSFFVFSSMGYIAGSFLAGFLFHKFSGNKVLAICLLGMALGVGLLPVIHRLWLLIVVVFLIGITQSSVDMGHNTMMVWLHGSKVAPYMNGLHFSFGIGSFLAPLMIAQSLRATHYINWAFWIIAITMLLPIPFLIKLTSPSNPETVAATTDEPARPKVSRKLLVFLVMFFLFFTGSEITFTNWIYTHGLKTGFVDVETAAYLTSSFWVTFLIARFVGIGISRRFTSRQIIWFNLTGSFFTLILMLILSGSAWALWACTAAFGLFVATGFPTSMNLAGELNAVTARNTSIFFVASSTSVMISPWIVGQFIDRPHSQVLIWVVMANLCLAIIAMAGVQIFGKSQFQPEAQPKEIRPRSISTD